MTNKDTWKIKLISDGSSFGVKLSGNASSLIEEVMQKIAMSPDAAILSACPNCNTNFVDIETNCICGLYTK